MISTGTGSTEGTFAFLTLWKEQLPAGAVPLPFVVACLDSALALKYVAFILFYFINYLFCHLLVYLFFFFK